MGTIIKMIVRIRAGSVHKAMNNFGFFTTLGHLIFILKLWKYSFWVKKGCRIHVQQPFYGK